jgi:hypothetical protein
MTVAALFQSEREQFVNQNGKPIVGGKLYIGEPNQDPKTNPKVVYAERSLTNALTQPIELDAEGRTDVSVWVDGSYSYVVDDADDVQQVTEAFIEVLDIPALIAEIIAEIIAVEGTGVKNLLPNGGMTVTLGTNVALSSTFQEGLVSGAWGRATNATAGTLTGEINDAYSSGRVCLYSGVSLPGAGDYIEHQHRLYSGDAVRIRERGAVFSCYVEHNKASAVDFTIAAGICNALNNFAAYTLVDTSDPVSVDPSTKTRLTFAIPDMGDTTNGVVFLLKASMGVIVLKDVRIGDAQIEVGEAVSDFVMLPYQASQAAIIAQNQILPDGFKATTGTLGEGGTDVATQEYADDSSTAAAELATEETAKRTAPFIVQVPVREYKTTGTGATWTIPAGVTAFNIEGIGGGSGSEGSTGNSAAAGDTTVIYNGVTYTASGAAGSANPVGGTGTNGDENIQGTKGAPGHAGVANTGGATYGAGGQVAVAMNGGGGGFFRVRIVVVPGETTATYTIGAGSAAGTGLGGVAGKDGRVVFEY